MQWGGWNIYREPSPTTTPSHLKYFNYESKCQNNADLIPVHTEKFEDTKGVSKSYKSKDRQYSGQQKEEQTMIYQALHTGNKLKVEQHEPH